MLAVACQFIVQAIIFLNVKASAVLLFVGIMYVCVIVLGLLRMLRNPGPHAVLTRIFQKLMHAGEKI